MLIFCWQLDFCIFRTVEYQLLLVKWWADVWDYISFAFAYYWNYSNLFSLNLSKVVLLENQWDAFQALFPQSRVRAECFVLWISHRH